MKLLLLSENIDQINIQVREREREILILISLYHETKVSKGIMKSNISNI